MLYHFTFRRAYAVLSTICRVTTFPRSALSLSASCKLSANSPWYLLKVKKTDLEKVSHLLWWYANSSSISSWKDSHTHSTSYHRRANRLTLGIPTSLNAQFDCQYCSILLSIQLKIQVILAEIYTGTSLTRIVFVQHWIRRHRRPWTFGREIPDRRERRRNKNLSQKQASKPFVNILDWSWKHIVTTGTQLPYRYFELHTTSIHLDRLAFWY